MKIITATYNWDINQLADTLRNKLNPIFKKHRHININFNIIQRGGTIEVNQPEYYDGYLFSLKANGNELQIAKSEHYVDDVNFITLQSIIETLQMDNADGADIVYISGE